MPPIRHRLRIRSVAAIGAVALLVAACSSSAGSATTAPTSGPSAAPSAASPATMEHTVGVGSGAVGAYLIGPDGKTLYIFTPDSANTSTCVDGCAQAWPPLTVPSGTTPTGGDGVTGTLSTFARPDGTLQVAYDGAPLYFYSGDTAPGDTNGQGLNGKWFVASPSGEQPAASAATSAY